jgi:hypothetical protein
MLGLALALLLSQHPPAAAPEHGPVQELLAALEAKYRCVRPGGTPEPLCDAALVERHGSAADVRGRNLLLGLTWRVKRDKAGRPSVGAPWLSALALHKDSLGLWSALRDFEEVEGWQRQELARFTKEYEVFLRGRKAGVELPCFLRPLLETWSRWADRLAERQGGAWVPRGLPTRLRKVGERWVAVSVPADGDGLLLSIFVVRTDVAP